MAIPRATPSKYAPAPVDYLVEVARGNIPNSRAFSIPGKRDGVSNTIFEDITAAPLPANGMLPDPGGNPIRVLSSSADDDGGGVGVQQVIIEYLTPEGVEKSETITLTGTTPVASVNTDYGKIQWAHAAAVGSNGYAAGNIDIEESAGLEVYERIPALQTHSMSSRYHVPAACEALVMGWDASAAVQRVEFNFSGTARKLGHTLLNGVFVGMDGMTLSSSALRNVYPVPMRFPPGATIKIGGKSVAVGGNASASFDIILLEPNN